MNTQGVELPQLYQVSQTFFEKYGNGRLLGRRFSRLFKKCKDENRFRALMRACGYKDNPRGFFKHLCRKLETIAATPLGEKPDGIKLNGYQLPQIYIYHLLELFWPGEKKTADPMAIRSAAQVEKWVPGKTEKRLDQVLSEYPVRLSHHVIRQSMVSNPVAAQYLPFDGELDGCGHDATFEGHFKTGVVEQMYQNRMIFLLTMQCPVYCRFCFRKHKDLRHEACPTIDEIQAAVAQVQNNPNIKEVLVTGGEPLYHRLNLAVTLQGLMEVDHLDVIRIATRSVSYYPQLFLDNGGELLDYLLEYQGECRQRGKRIEIGLHFLHAHEISVQSLEVISKLVHGGIKVYLQTPFLTDVNAEGKPLSRLFSQLRRAGVEIYYIFTPCHPIHGTRRYWSDISTAIQAQTYLRAHLSDRAVPKLCTATSLGKIEWNSSGWIVDTDGDDPRNIWIRTPYTQEYFRDFIQDAEALPHVRENAEGTLDVQMMASPGEEISGINLSPGPELSIQRSLGDKGAKAPVQTLPEDILTRENSLSALVPGAIAVEKGVYRTHKTRVDMDLAEEFDLSYVKDHPKVTDIVLHGVDPKDPSALEELVEKVKSIEHIQALRLCCPDFWRETDLWSWDWIDQILEWQDTSVTTPFRVELETWWLTPDQLGEEQILTAREWAGTGIDIYANVPLISGVNDSPETIRSLAHGFRRGEMDFHHLYVAGLSLQNQWNAEHPMEASSIIDIASDIRQFCSGREIPLYIIRTPLGEVDFGLGTTLVQGEEGWEVSLPPYTMEYYGKICLDFALPPGAREEDRMLYIPVQGVVG